MFPGDVIYSPRAIPLGYALGEYITFPPYKVNNHN